MWYRLGSPIFLNVSKYQFRHIKKKKNVVGPITFIIVWYHQSNSVASSSDSLMQPHIRLTHTTNRKGARGKNVVKNKTNQHCSKLPEMAGKLVKNICLKFLTNIFTLGVFPRCWLSWESQYKNVCIGCRRQPLPLDSRGV